MKVHICCEQHFVIEVENQEELEKRLRSGEFEDVATDFTGEVYKIEEIEK